MRASFQTAPIESLAQMLSVRFIFGNCNFCLFIADACIVQQNYILIAYLLKIKIADPTL